MHESALLTAVFSPPSSMQEDPAMTRWVYARTNIYPNFRPTPKNSLLGAVWGIGPVLFWWYVFKTERDYREKLLKEGKYERSPFQICT
uniref:NADH dehydrogenase [ubiquinone] 1 beta subcomplex subunit 4 n=1 Tax=Sphenodon punctatus TaxID=8508 RepID=A0A8D0L3P5_SPHPU